MTRMNSGIRVIRVEKIASSQPSGGFLLSLVSTFPLLAPYGAKATLSITQTRHSDFLQEVTEDAEVIPRWRCDWLDP